jgi:pyruvate kinase
VRSSPSDFCPPRGGGGAESARARAQVVEVYPKKGEVKTRICNNQTIGERKNMNLPGVKVDLPVLQEKDVNDLVNFAVPQGVDFIAASFVQSADDIAFIRKTLGAAGKDIKIIAKIENQEGLDKFDEILAATDVVMVARGDLGMEIAQERVFLEQKRLVRMCNAAGKPVIVATQMLESMTANPRPTRAEVSDVANAVLDGADAVMLSGETAGGAHPTTSAETMMTIAETANASINHARRYRDLVDDDWASGGVTASEFVTSSVVKASFLMPDVAAIIALVDTGRTAARIAKYRPRVPIIAVVPKSNARFARQLYGAHRGMFPVLVEVPSGAE